MSSNVPDQILDHLLNIYATSYDTEITELADNDTDEQQALYIELSYLDEDLTADFRNDPETLTKFATNALHQYANKQDIDLGNVNIRLIDTDNTTRIGELRAKHNDSLVTIPGTIRSTSSVTSYPTEAAFQCQRCGTITYIPQPDSLDYENLDEPQECQGCERQGPFKLNKSQSEYIDVQQFRIESTLSDPEIENPESIIAIAKNDIVGTAKPGDSVSLTGTVKLLGYGNDRPNLDATVNDKYIDISSINPLETGSLSPYSQSDVEKFIEESNRSDLYQRIVDSIAPHVPGCEDVKLAVALQLFGGIKKELDDGTTIPGNIHIGIAADPGKFTAEIVDYAAHIAPKSTRVDGTDTSQVGLTTAAYKSKSGTKSWELDAGALVLADNGIACLTQIDQLNDKSQAALFSVMRDQEVKASKGTATQTLPAETSILASMSPKYGRFDQYEPIGEQIVLAPTLISHFDLIFTLFDQPGEKQDAEHANHILDANHAGEAVVQKREDPISELTDEDVEDLVEDVSATLSPVFLRKYINYAKRNCHPVMSDEAKNAIHEFYVSTRSHGIDEDAPVPITARKIEAIVRLAEASARARLAETVTVDDADRAIDLVETSLRGLGVDPDTGQFDADVVETASVDTDKNDEDRVKSIIRDLADEYEEGVPVEKVIERAAKFDIDRQQTEQCLDDLRRKGEAYEPKQNHLRAT